MKNVRTQSQGFIVAAILIMMLGLIAIGTVTMSLASSNYQTAQADSFRLNAQLAADAGADAAVQQLNIDTDWTGTGETAGIPNEVTVLNTAHTKTTYSAVVTDDASDPLKKTVAVTGRTYSPSSSTTARSERKYEIGLRGVTEGSYSVVSGVGGLIMENSAKIVNGSVFVNGKISLKNTAQIGLTISPVDVKAAHQSCPATPDATYPRQCASGENGEPISILNSGKIYGDVEATNQTNGANMHNSGLVTGSHVNPIAMPDYDRDAQKAAVAHTRTGSDAGCSIGLETWQANTKIEGDVTVRNLCVLTVHGNVWITGNLTLSNAAIIKVAEGVSTPPVIMVDGSSGVELANGATMLPNLGLVGFRVITYYSKAACSPDCADVTGADLFDSQDETTIDIKNSASGARTEFYARWTQLEAGNSGSIGAVAGQTIRLKNSLAITIGTAVSGFGETVWLVDSYRRVF